MAVGISRSIGIGMKKCCGGGTISPPPPQPFPLRFINTFNVPLPSGCDTFEASITITRNGTTFLASEMTKSSNNTSVTTVNPISVYTTDIVEVAMEAFPITDPACSSANTTELQMAVGSLGGINVVRTKTSNDSPPTALYQFSPIQNSLDIVNITGTATNVTPPPSTFNLSVQATSLSPSNCDAFEAYVYIDRNDGQGFVEASRVIKTSGNAASITNSSITVTSTDKVRVQVQALAISNVQCNNGGFTGTDATLYTGATGSMTARFTVSDPNTDYYPSSTGFFNPVQGVEDIIEIRAVAVI